MSWLAIAREVALCGAIHEGARWAIHRMFAKLRELRDEMLAAIMEPILRAAILGACLAASGIAVLAILFQRACRSA